MQNVKIQIVGKIYEISLDDDFYNYIKSDIEQINNSKNPIRDLLSLMLEAKNALFENEKKLENVINQIERIEK